jgi:hypothetical protein
MPTSRIAIALAVATTLVAGKAASQALPRAHVTGHVMDGSGGVVPGARVTVRAIGMRRQATSDAAGRFDVADVPPGSYVVTAELAGFEAAVRKVIVTTPDSMVDVSLTVSIEFCHRDLVVDRGFRDTAIESDAILHVRITGVAPTRGIKKGCSADADTFTATVLEGITVRAEDADQSTIRWVQDLDSPGPRTGQEYLIFLTWDAANSRYSAAEGLYVFPVRADHVEWNRDDAPSIRNGDPVAHVTDAIRGVLAPLRSGR